MKTKKYVQAKNATMGKRVLIGVLTALALSALITAVAALLTVNGRISEQTAGYTLYGTQFFAAFVACMISTKRVSDKRAQVCIIVTAIYAAILASANILIFEAGFSGLLASVIILAVAMASACVLGLCAGSKRSGKRFVTR